MISILVVDDDPGDFQLVTQTLKRSYTESEFTAVNAGTIAEGLARLAEQDIDLVLLDLGLPDSHGLETVNRICEVYPHLPIVVLTGLDSEEAGLDSLRRGASDYLVKGKLSDDLLCRTIRYSLERKRLERRLIHLASHDALTGALNRRAFGDVLSQAVARARRGVASALLMCDVDGFKAINDALGHKAGDDTLVRVAELVRNELRGADILARLGGDEFAVLLDGIGNLSDARAVAERIRRSMAALHADLDGSIQPTLSIGVVQVTGQHGVEELLAEADARMYEAKTQGRDQVCVQMACP